MRTYSVKTWFCTGHRVLSEWKLKWRHWHPFKLESVTFCGLLIFCLFCSFIFLCLVVTFFLHPSLFPSCVAVFLPRLIVSHHLHLQFVFKPVSSSLLGRLLLSSRRFCRHLVFVHCVCSSVLVSSSWFFYLSFCITFPFVVCLQAHF